MSNTTEDFKDYCAKQGFVINEPLSITNQGQWKRVAVNDDTRRRESKAYYTLTEDGNFSSGCLFIHKGGEKVRWYSKIKSSWSEEDRKAYEQAKLKAEKLAKEKEKKKEASLHRRLIAFMAGLDDVPKGNEYIERKKITAYGAKYYKKRKAIIIPIYRKGKIGSLQLIYPNGAKYFLRGGLISEGYFVMRGDDSTILITEGYATGATLHEATGLTVFVCFTANNLSNVGQIVRKKFLDNDIIVCCDNDQFTFSQKHKPKDVDVKSIPGDDERWEEWRTSGKLYNTGVTLGGDAAVRIKAKMVVPQFANLKDKPTDFNDLHCISGLEAVRDQVFEATTVSQESDTSADAHSPQTDEGAGVSDIPTYRERVKAYFNDYFRILGYNNGSYFYLPRGSRQIVSLTAASHSYQNLLQLAPLECWETFIYDVCSLKGNVSQSVKVTYITDALISISHEQGIFNQETAVRGAGAWTDGKSRILHCGDIIYQDGEPMKIEDVESAYVYVAASKLFRPSKTPLSTAEAIQLRQLCEMPTWESKLSGGLLAGWLVIASMCAMLPWRPHIWIRGEAQAGKSTVLDEVIKPALGKVALNLDGGTTEPALREALGYDGRPIVYDEAESKGENQRRIMQDVLFLARKASSGATIKKSGQKPFKAQFCACFSGINTNIKDAADEQRITILTLKRNRKESAQKEYDDFLNKISDVIKPGFSERLLSRTVNLMPIILQNIDTFKKVVRSEFGGARFSDQFAPMIAGLYSLGADDLVSEDSAKKWVRAQNWDIYRESLEAVDYMQCINHLVGSTLRVNTSSGARDISIAELLYCASGGKKGEVNQDTADKALRQACMCVKDNLFIIANSSPALDKIFRQTPWADGWKGTLSDVPNSKVYGGCYFAPGIPRSRAVGVPLGLLLEIDEDEKQEDLLGVDTVIEEIEF